MVSFTLALNLINRFCFLGRSHGQNVVFRWHSEPQSRMILRMCTCLCMYGLCSDSQAYMFVFWFQDCTWYMLWFMRYGNCVLIHEAFVFSIHNCTWVFWFMIALSTCSDLWATVITFWFMSSSKFRFIRYNTSWITSYSEFWFIRYDTLWIMSSDS